VDKLSSESTSIASAAAFAEPLGLESK